THPGLPRNRDPNAPTPTRPHYRNTRPRRRPAPDLRLRHRTRPKQPNPPSAQPTRRRPPHPTLRPHTPSRNTHPNTKRLNTTNPPRRLHGLPPGPTLPLQRAEAEH